MRVGAPTNAGAAGGVEIGPDEGFDALAGRYGNMIEMASTRRGGPLRVAERRLGGRAAAHHELAGRRGADAVGRQRLG
jgi:hypothetical protein